MKRTRLYVVILIVLLIIGITGKVNAESVTFRATANTQTLKEGEEVEITLNLSNINVNEDGIHTFGGKIVYDKEIFEEIEEDNFEGKNNWSIAYNSEHTEKEGTFLATRNTGLKTSQEIGKLTLKIKTNIKSTKTEIKFIEVSSVGQDTIELDDEVITLSITGTKKDDNINKQPDNTIDGNTTDDNNGNDNNGNGNNGNGNNGNDNNGNGNNGNGNNGNDNNGNGNSGNGNNGNNNNGNGNGNNGENNGNGGSTITIKNQTNQTKNNADNTTSNGKIPQTGVESISIVIIGIAILTVMIIAYTKYKKNLDIK